MALPLLFGLLGSGMASAGMLGGMGALTAGALGSGIGSLAETGDLGKGIQAGLTSFLGGKMLGDTLGNIGSTATSPAALSTANESLAPVTSIRPVPRPELGGALTQSAKPSGIMGMLGNQFSDPTKAYAGQGIGSLMKQPVLPYVAGAALPSALSAAGKYGMGGGDRQSDDKWPLGKKPGRTTQRPDGAYRPGYDPEFNYRVSRGFAGGGIASLAQGGGQDEQIIAAAVAALKGEVADPRPALGAFLTRFGEDALRELVNRVRGEPGVVEGEGDGMSDDIPANIDGQEEIAVSDGEFIVPADVVSGLGNGSSKAGSDRLMEMMDAVRHMRTGDTRQPAPIDPTMVMPA